MKNSRRSAVSAAPIESPLAPGAFDRVAGMLVAVLIVLGFFVLLLFLVWMTNRAYAPPPSTEVTLLEEVGGRTNLAEGAARELEEPGLEEIEYFEEPALEQTLEAVTDVVSNQAATLEALEGADPQAGRGEGLGDNRQTGQGGEGEADAVPRWERWRIIYSSASLREYAEQLDYFGVELGAVGGGSPQVDYVYNVSQNPPERRAGSSDEESRLYMSWRSGKLAEYDRRLLARAGAPTESRVILQFYPPEIEARLAALESRAADGREVGEIRQTIFEVVGSPGDYTFEVAEQQFL